MTEKLRIVQIATAAPINPLGAKPFLFAVVDDKSTLDHVRVWNWLEKRWMRLEEVE